MRKYIFTSISLVVCVFFCSGKLIAADSSLKEKALQALITKDYDTAINISIQQLESSPESYDFNFILSRAYAYSGQWEKALSILNKMLNLHCENTDLLLFRSRIQAWKGNYNEAKLGYQKVLMLSPRNIEAMIGRAEIACWKSEFKEALNIYRKALQHEPDNAEIYFRIGRIYQWQGNYSMAKKNFTKAAGLDPENEEFRLALNRASPHLGDQFEIRYQHKNEGFNDGRNNYIDHQLTFGFKISDEIGSLFLKYNRTERFNERDDQYGVELYPHLWTGAYGYMDISYSQHAIHFPRTSYLIELYQALLPSTEMSLGYRRMNFEAKAISIYLGSFGYYFGNYYSYLRWYYSPEERGRTLSWTVNVRRYFSKDDYLFLGYGQGSRPFNVMMLEDIFITQSWIFLVGGDWCFLKRIRLRLEYFHISEESGLKRNAFLIITGYRW